MRTVNDQALSFSATCLREPLVKPEQEAMGVFPLTPMQESLWILAEMAPESTAYNLPDAWRLTGQLDVPILERCLNELAKRHETLRTVIRGREGRPEQVVRAPGPVGMTIVDLTRSSEPEAGLREAMREEVLRPFQLSHQLWRPVLYRLSDRENVLLVNIHHIVTDARSQSIFIRDLSALYCAFSAGRPSPLSELPIQYGDYAVWLRDGSDEKACQERLEDWLKQMPRPVPRLGLPFARGEIGIPARGRMDSVTWPKELSDALKQASRFHRTTLFVTILAAFQAWLHRCTGDTDIVVGAPFTTRQHTDTENLIGFFVNTLPLRVDASGEPDFGEMIRRAKQVVLNASRVEGVPLTTIASALDPARGNGAKPLFQVVLSLEQPTPAEWTWGDVRASRMDVESGAPKFDWTLFVQETDAGLRIRSEYNSDLFSPGEMSAFLRSFEEFVSDAVRSPEKKLSELCWIGRRDLDMVVVGHNQTQTPYESELGVHRVFEMRAAERPEATALEFGGKTLTYRELDERSSRVAAWLMSEGVERGALVGIGMQRSLEMIVALLGVLKSGAAYVPLDPNYPAERLQSMLADCNPARILVDEQFPRLPDSGTARVISIDRVLQERRPEQTHGSCPAAGDNTAYVMYTSGTTGQPKGVVVPHRAIVRLVRNTNYCEFRPEDTFLQLAPTSFDASTFEIWGALLNGARLVIAPPEALSLQDLGRVLKEKRVTTLWLSAGLFNQMVDFGLEGLAGIRQLLTGGEALSVPHVLKANGKLAGCQLINGYGPTENTTFTCCYRIPKSWAGGRSVPIGEPVSNTQVFVLDREFRPVPVGVPGELYAGGDGLGKGYLNAPDLTAKKFVRAPAGLPCRGVIYRTGDLVRWLPDGTLEFLGRIDQQVKVRGFRVEPGEIEAVLQTHRTVLCSVVVARPDHVGTKRLLAYVIAKAGEALDEGELRSFLESKLPQFMVPSHILQIDALPLTANGKLDRDALPAPSVDSGERVERTLIMPRNDAEQQIRDIWVEVLERKSFGVEQNFFELGGHSLLATQVLARVGRSLGVDLPLRALFDAPTVAGLAALVTRESGNAKPIRGIAARRNRATQLLGRLQELSDEEVEALLANPELNEIRK